jgi:hypothetical protein
VLRSPGDGKVYQARQNLSCDDALLLATTAKHVFRLNAQVSPFIKLFSEEFTQLRAYYGKFLAEVTPIAD